MKYTIEYERVETSRFTTQIEANSETEAIDKLCYGISHYEDPIYSAFLEAEDNPADMDERIRVLGVEE